MDGNADTFPPGKAEATLPLGKADTAKGNTVFVSAFDIGSWVEKEWLNTLDTLGNELCAV